jgi:hypothetical protein
MTDLRKRGKMTFSSEYGPGSPWDIDEQLPAELPSKRQCMACKQLYAPEDLVKHACFLCRKQYPASLIKSAWDPYEYVLKLTTGDVVHFESAEICGDYVHLFCAGSVRGMDVRVSEIVWCEDTGH